jgi:endonuclease YncB( thermonuclease family)
MRKHLFFQDEKDKDKMFYEADVLRIIDGDTIDVEHNYKVYRIRVKGIDAPESNQPFGWESHKFLHELIGNTSVYISTTSTGFYDREISQIFDNDFTDISNVMIQNGYAWADFENNKFDPEIKKMQDHAKKQKKGLWQDDNPIQPKIWRQHKMSMKPDEQKKLKNNKSKYLKDNSISKKTEVFSLKRPPIPDMPEPSLNKVIRKNRLR